MIALTTAAVAAHVGAYGWGAPWLFFLIPLFWILIIGLFFAIFGRRWRRHGGPYGRPGWQEWQSQNGSRSAESTLSERFAQGDIDEAEYRARLEVLRANSAPTPPEPR